MKVLVEEYPENKFYPIFKIFKKNSLKKVLILVFGITILPSVLLLINIIAFTGTKYLVFENNPALSKTYFYFIYKTSQVSDGLMYYYTKPFLLRGIYNQLYPFSQALTRSSNIGMEKAETVLLIDRVLEKPLRQEEFDVNEECGKVVLEIDKILEKENFRKAENKSLGNFFLMRHFFSEEILNTYPDTNLLIKIRDIAEKFGNILGGNEERNYVLLFQNQNTIRPSGGVITSVAILSFNKGNMINISFYSPDEIDKHLIGGIEPPHPLNNQESMWKFKDANWKSDFVSESKDVEWFLEKSLEIKTDGVVFINKKVTEKRLIEEQVNNFSGLSTFRKLKKINNIFENDGKPLLIYMDKDDESRVFEKAGLSNYIFDTQCNSCLQDFLGIIESDLVGNEYNNFIERRADLEISLEGNVVKKKLTLLLKRIKDEKNRYQIFLRFIVPKETSFSPALIDGKKYLGRVENADNYKQLDLLVEVGEKETEKAIYLELEGTSVNNTSFNSYAFDWISQPGVLNLYSRLTIQPYLTKEGNIISNESLTKSEEGVYNTNLVPLNKDIKLNLYF